MSRWCPYFCSYCIFFQFSQFLGIRKSCFCRPAVRVKLVLLLHFFLCVVFLLWLHHSLIVIDNKTKLKTVCGLHYSQSRINSKAKLKVLSSRLIKQVTMVLNVFAYFLVQLIVWLDHVITTSVGLVVLTRLAGSICSLVQEGRVPPLLWVDHLTWQSAYSLLCWFHAFLFVVFWFSHVLFLLAFLILFLLILLE